jgi:uncharacterized Zn-binding protein involved in type VI secretion
MGQPAARITDMHTCPMQTPAVVPIPHVGGPIIGPCSPNVITGSLLQARVTDQCICVGPPDVIVKGSMTVLVNNLQAARIGDLTAHGGVIVTGMPTVLIGDQATGGGGGGIAQGKGEDATLKSGQSGGVGTAEVNQVSSAAAMSSPGVQAGALLDAAKSGTPFCEVCARAAAERARNAANEAAAAAQAAATEAAKNVDPVKALDGLAEKLEATVPPALLAERKATAQKFFEEQGLEPQQAKQLMKGIDFSKPVELVDIPPPETLYQYVRKAGGKVGEWFSPYVQEARALGLNPDPAIRELKQFKAPSTKVLKSTAAAVVDHWTNKGVPVPTPGGGEQMVVPKNVINTIKAL